MFKSLMTFRALCCATTLSAPIAVHAQQQVFQLDIPAQNMGNALKALASATGQQIIFKGQTVRGKRSNAVKGSYSPDSAIKAMISGLNLSISRTNRGVILVEPGRVITASVESTSSYARPEARIPDDEQNLAIPDIVVTAQKRSENLQKVPVSAVVISNESVIEQNQSSLQTVTQMTPGVHVANGGRSDDMYIRGVGAGNGQYFDQAVATFIDGVYHGRSRSSAATFLDLERIEILKGPQSTFFGNNAIAGALNILSKKPGDKAEGYARALYGSYGQYLAEGAVTVPLSPVFSMRAAATLSGEDGWIKNVSTGETAPRRNNKAGRLTFAYQPDANLDITLKLEAADSEQDGSGWAGPLQFIGCDRGAAFLARFGADCATARTLGLPLGFDNNKNSGVPGQGNEFRNYESVLTVNYKFADHTITSVTGYNDFKFGIRADGSNFPTPGLTVSAPERHKQFSQEFRLASPTGQTIEYLAGAYFQSSRTRADRFTTYAYLNVLGATQPAVVPYLPIAAAEMFSQEQKVYALFGSLTWNVTDRLKLSGGMRATWDHKDADINSFYGRGTRTFGGVVPVPANISAIMAGAFRRSFGTPSTVASLSGTDHAILPSAKIQYDFGRNAMAYASYSRGFLAGGFNGSDTTGVIANVPFKPEYVDAYEIGLKSKLLDGRILLNLAAFRSDYEDLQVTSYVGQPVSGGGTVYISGVRNAASSRSQGIEFETQWAVSPEFRLTANGIYLDAKYLSYPNGPATFDQAVLGLVIQDLSGKPTQSAPKWSGSIAAELTVPLSDDYRFVAEATPYFTAGYFVGNDADDPYFRQGGHTRVDARISLQNLASDWAIDIIGKNLTNLALFEAGLTPLRGWKSKPRNIAIQFRYNW